MNKQVMLTVGQTYPMQVPVFGGGATAEFMRSFGNKLVVIMPGISEYEAEVFRRGNLNCGLLEKDGAILLLWEFRDGRSKVVTLDSPFDARIIPDLTMDESSISESGFSIDIHIVDSSNNMVKGLRRATMPIGLSRELMSAVKKQLRSKLDGEAQMNRWMQKEPYQLAKKTLMWEMAG
ncbi:MULTISPECIES: hypothetical protein [Vibrio harveyi group]|uniref:hypothetical protein n=1 Tax=Vibrio harveyi group TaxID=717610 RepID=UPI000C270F58|nr:hypothetical protein [Vibrio parahaemolyticus]MDG2841095.1 hypothetical protein [Vibrio parahaemolyticus]MDG2862754.1 hypothetical protein [Vibrio parahaemolyticus]PJN44417.1 hypothetical protein CNR26_18195 [Vibrio parahaemolyticus]